MTLRQLLRHAAGLDAEYGHNLASHLPMALSALARLGATDARLAAFAAHYAGRLRPAPPRERWPAGEAWTSRLGEPRAWPAYRSLFSQWIRREGAPAVLEQVLPTLLRGVGAAAFHGPIRAAYALAAGQPQQLDDALAYWACRWFALGSLSAGGREHDPVAALAGLRMARPRRPLIAERMAIAAQHPAFGRVASELRIDRDHTLPQLAMRAARLYAASENFTVLHLLTSAHAMRVLLPSLAEGDVVVALGHYWLAFVAGHAASGLAERTTDGAMSRPSRPWPEIVSRAIASNDDHVIKVVDSCREQERAYGGAVWREAASRAVAGA